MNKECNCPMGKVLGSCPELVIDVFEAKFLEETDITSTMKSICVSDKYDGAVLEFLFDTPDGLEGVMTYDTVFNKETMRAIFKGECYEHDVDINPEIKDKIDTYCSSLLA